HVRSFPTRRSSDLKRALAGEVFLGQWWALIGQMILCGDERNRAREFFLTQCFGGLGSGQATTNNDNIFWGTHAILLITYNGRSAPKSTAWVIFAMLRA